MELIAVALVGLYAYAEYVCFTKGKKVFAVLGLGAIFLPLAPILAWFPIVGSLRPAKDDPEFGFGGDATGDASGTDADEAGVVAGFLSSAVDAGVIDEAVRLRLLDHLHRPPSVTSTSTESVVEAPPDEIADRVPPIVADGPARALETPDGPRAVPTPPPIATPRRPAPTSPPVAPRRKEQPKVAPPPPSSSPPPKSPPPPLPAPPPTPREPSVLALRVRELRRAVSADVALHGFAYLGVLLTFVGVLGFLLFAFTDLPDHAQPFVELFGAAVFFGWAWVLRRQEALNVARAMEVLGGALLPLIIFAGLVDGAPFPPDFTDGGLVAALVTTSVALAAVYYLLVRRNKESMLRTLVLPLVWLAGLAGGLAFKTDERLVSDAITRFVAAQPAVAAIVIAVTLSPPLRRRAEERGLLVVVPALIGVPAAYLLAIALSVAQGGLMALSASIAGIATIASVVQLADHYEKPVVARLVTPLVLAGALFPLVGYIGRGWLGVAGAVGYLAVVEWFIRTDVDHPIVWPLALGGVVGSLIVSLAEPWAGVIAFALAILWAHWRRQTGVPYEQAATYMLAAAGSTTLGFGYAVFAALPAATAVPVLGGITAVAGIVTRRHRSDDHYWEWWPAVSAGIVAIIGLAAGGVARVTAVDPADLATTSGIVLAAVTIGLGRSHLVPRAAVVVAVLATASFMYVGPAPASAAAVVAYLGVSEWQVRRESGAPLDWNFLATGTGAALALALIEPWPTVLGFAALSVWVHWRRSSGSFPVVSPAAASTLAAVAPVGLGWGLWRALGGPEATVAMSIVVLLVAAGARLADVDGDVFWEWWPTTTALLVAGLATAQVGVVRISPTAADVAASAALAVSAAAIGLGRRHLRLRASAVAGLGVVGLLPYMAVGWAGLAGLGGFLAVAEWHARRPGLDPWSWAAWSVGLGATGAMVFLDPWTALVGHAALGSWLHWRRTTGIGVDGAADPLTVAAAVVPVGVGWALWELMSPPGSLVAMAGVVLAVVAAVRLLGASGTFWVWWPTAASSAVVGLGLGVAGLARVDVMTGERLGALVAIALASAALAASPRFTALRVWSLVPIAMAASVPHLDPEWIGAVSTLLFLAVAQWTARRPADAVVWSLSLLGAVGAVALTTTEPIAALVGFGAISIWVHVHRLVGTAPRFAAEALTVVAVTAPLGLGWSIWSLAGAASASLIIAGTLFAAAVVARLLVHDDMLWAVWPPLAALLLGVFAVSAAGVPPYPGQTAEAWSLVAALALVAGTVATGPLVPGLRSWTAAAVLLGDLHIALEIVALDPTARVAIWSGVGLALVVVGTFGKSWQFDHGAAIGHLVGTGLLAFMASSTQQAVAISAWSVGWGVAVLAAWHGRGSLERLLRRVASRALVPGRGLDWVAPVAFVVSAPVAVIMSLNLWEAFADNRSWAGLAMSGVALAVGLGSRVGGGRQPVRRSFAVAAAIHVVIGVAVSAPVPWPTIASTATAIGVALLVAPGLRSAAMSWFAWLMSGVMVTLLAERAGVAADDLYLVVLGMSVLFFLGGVILDDVLEGRRAPGEGLRRPWTRFPVLLGSIAVPATLAPIVAVAPDAAGWAAIAAAVGYGVVALLLHSPLVTAPGYGLATFGVLSLLPVAPIDESALLPGAAATLIAISEALRMWGPGERAGDVWSSWDLPPLVIAHLVAGVALVASAPTTDPVPWLLIGLLSGVVGVRRDGRLWLDAGNVMVLVGASFIGEGAIAGALALTSLRAMYETTRVTDPMRPAAQALAVLTAATSWVLTVAWLGWSVAEATALTALLFGATGLVVGIAGALEMVRADTVAWWALGALGGVGYAAAATFVDPLDGGSVAIVASPAIGLVLLAVAAHMVRWRIAAIPEQVPAVVGGLSWITLLVNTAWPPIQSVVATALVGGVVVLVAVEVLRRVSEATMPHPVGWAVIGLLHVLGSLIASIDIDDRVVWAVGAGPALALVALASTRAATRLPDLPLRDVGLWLGLASLLLTARGLEATPHHFVTVLLVVSVLGSVALVALGSRPDSEGRWVIPLAKLAVGALIGAAAVAATVLPSTTAMTAVLLVGGGQLLFVGLSWAEGRVVALGPLLLGAGIVLIVGESATGLVQWYTLPLAIAMLAEIEIVRIYGIPGLAERLPRLDVVEWSAIGIGVLPPLVDMFARSLSSVYIALGFSAALLVWSVLTRVRRRAVAAAVVGVASSVLLLAAALSDSQPESAAFWIIAVGLGFAVMAVAGIVEAARSRRGVIVRKIDELMGGWG